MMDDKLVRLSHAISAAKTGADDWDGGCNIERDRYIEKAFADIPAVDAVEVVRCRECRWCHAGFCELHDDIIPWGAAHTRWRDWFCADGERIVDGDA